MKSLPKLSDKFAEHLLDCCTVWVPCGATVHLLDCCTVWVPCGATVHPLDCCIVCVPCGATVHPLDSCTVWAPCGAMSVTLNVNSSLGVGCRKVPSQYLGDDALEGDVQTLLSYFPKKKSASENLRKRAEDWGWGPVIR